MHDRKRPQADNEEREKDLRSPSGDLQKVFRSQRFTTYQRTPR
jgi:hypothetical protein